MATAPSTSYQFTIIELARDAESVAKNLPEYKALRLLSLKINPEAFHSTYAGELAFTEEIWIKRLTNPIARTFVALNAAAQMVSMTTITGPLDHGPHDLPVLGAPMVPLTDEESLEPGRQLHYRLNAVFTHPDARRKGVAQALILEAVRRILESVPLAKRPDLVFSVIVELDVLSAKALYEKSGFVETKRIHRQEEAYLTNVAFLQYVPGASPVVRSG